MLSIAILLTPLLAIPFFFLNRYFDRSDKILVDLSSLTSPSQFIQAMQRIRYVLGNYKQSPQLNQIINGLLSFHTKYFNSKQLEVLTVIEKDKSSFEFLQLHLRQFKRYLFLKYQEAINRHPSSEELIISFCYFLRENESETSNLPDLDNLFFDLPLGFFREYEVYCLK